MNMNDEIIYLHFQVEISSSQDEANMDENSGKAIAPQCKGCIISPQKTRSESRKSSGGDNRFPDVHEDYYGPRNHKPKHHKH